MRARVRAGLASDHRPLLLPDQRSAAVRRGLPLRRDSWAHCASHRTTGSRPGAKPVRLRALRRAWPALPLREHCVDAVRGAGARRSGPGRPGSRREASSRAAGRYRQSSAGCLPPLRSRVRLLHRCQIWPDTKREGCPQPQLTSIFGNRSMAFAFAAIVTSP